MTSCFGFRGSHESRQLTWERLTKTRTGGEDSRAFRPKMFAVGGDRCPIELYKHYESHRPSSMKGKDSPFYLGIKIHRSTYDPLWYVAQPMGKNKIQDIVPEMARNAGIKAKLTNHSLRHMTCQNLLSSGISPTVVIQLTGHKNVNSLQNYIVADDKQQQTMSNVLTLGKKKAKALAVLEEAREIQEIMGNEPIEAPPSNVKLDKPTTLTVSLPAPPNPRPNTSLSLPAPSQLTPHVPQDISNLAHTIPSGMFSGAFIGGNVVVNVNMNLQSSASTSLTSSQVNMSPNLRPIYTHL